MHQYLYGPDETTRSVTSSMIDGLDAVREFPLPRRVHAAVVRRVMSGSMMQTLPGRDVQRDLGLRQDRLAELAVAAAAVTLKGANQITRFGPVRRWTSRNGQRLIDEFISRGLGGVHAEFKPTAVTAHRTA